MTCHAVSHYGFFCSTLGHLLHLVNTPGFQLYSRLETDAANGTPNYGVLITSDFVAFGSNLRAFPPYFALPKSKMATKTTSSIDHIFRLFAHGFLLQCEFLDVYLKALGHFSLEQYHYNATFTAKMQSPNVVRSLVIAGRGSACSGSQRCDHAAVQCVCPGRGGELVSVCVTCG